MFVFNNGTRCMLSYNNLPCLCLIMALLLNLVKIRACKAMKLFNKLLVLM